MNLRTLDPPTLAITLDETTTREDMTRLMTVALEAGSRVETESETEVVISGEDELLDVEDLQLHEEPSCAAPDRPRRP